MATTTIKWDLRKFERQVGKLPKEMTLRIAAKVLPAQGKLAARDLAKATPPFVARGVKRGTFTQPWSVQRKAGRRAVRADIGRVFTQAQDMSIHEKPKDLLVGQAFRKLVKKQDLYGVRELLRRAGYDSEVQFTVQAGAHTRVKGRRRRTRKGKGTLIKPGTKKVIVIRPNEKKKYKKRIEANVGQAMSGWKTMATALGAKLPGWVTKHNIRGNFLDRTKDFPTPYIFFNNSVTWQSDWSTLGIVPAVLLNRKRSMRTQARKIAAAEAKKLNAKP